MPLVQTTAGELVVHGGEEGGAGIAHQGDDRPRRRRPSGRGRRRGPPAPATVPRTAAWSKTFSPCPDARARRATLASSQRCPGRCPRSGPPTGSSASTRRSPASTPATPAVTVLHRIDGGRRGWSIDRRGGRVRVDAVAGADDRVPTSPSPGSGRRRGRRPGRPRRRSAVPGRPPARRRRPAPPRRGRRRSSPASRGGRRPVPELPEVQAHAERLDADFAGAALERFTPDHLHRAEDLPTRPAEVASATPLVFVGRRGKHLLLDFGAATFVVHLMQGGRLKPDEKQSAKPRGGIARWRFERRPGPAAHRGRHRAQGRRLGGRRRPRGPAAARRPRARGRPTSTPPALLELLHAHPMRLHGFLRDQRILAGLGRRLANEICHRAKLSPFAIDRQARRRRRPRGWSRPSATCIGEGLAYERGRDDMSSSKERPGNVHGRAGEACPRVRRRRSASVEYTPLPGRLLRDLPDRRQDAGRQHHAASSSSSRPRLRSRPSSLTASRSSASSAARARRCGRG